jgi:Asp-tRNA(Asn)/Glu-tRNA(Gln) amidotransferase C subunit
MLARHGLAFSEADLAVGASQLEAIRQALEQLDQFEVAALEPTTYVCFDDRR